MTQLLRELQNVDKLESIDKIQFSLLSHEDINRGSVADVLTFDTYEGNMPKNNGLFDHNMGSIDAAIICPIDEKKAELCPGYFGKIDLALPVFNYHFMSIIEKVLKCVCFHCSKLLIDRNDPTILKELNSKKGNSRFKAICELCSKNKKCIYNGGCQALQPTKYIRKTKENNNIIKIYAEFAQNTFKDSEKASNVQNFTPLVVYQIFKKIKDEDVDFLGLSSKYSRPEWMIINSLTIPPPSVRPSIRQSDNQRSEDDLTYGLAMIVKANKMLKNAIENNPSNKKNIENFQGNLQYHISTYMDNEIPGVGQQTQRSTYRPLKAITQRLKGKEGRLRMNIMGKRVDYSARTVISVDPNLDIDQWGVPEKIAMNLTFPEIVNKYNIEKLRNMVLNGPNKYPGAKTVTKGKYGNQRNISLKHIDVVKVANELEIGDTVHRHLLDGDPCLFNRQPTLHKMSMMTHKIVILPYSTFRLNVTVCQPYNADFDGDEMNMHIPQSLQTQTELEKISLVHENLISPGNSKPSIEIVQDTLVGAYLLTIKDNKLNQSQMYNYMMFDKKFNGKLPEPEFVENGIKYWSGKQLFSLVLPDINISQLKNVKIIHGSITDGYLSKDSLGKDQAGIIKQIFNVYGTGECVKFLNNTQKLITRWMMDHSFSISFGDSILNKEERNKVIDLNKKYYEDVYDILKMAHYGTYATELDDSMKYMKMEGDIKKILSECSEEIKKTVMKNISKSNGFYISGDWGGAGSKGTSTNMQQILGCVGQQDIWGSRIENGFSERTLPHFHKNDIGPSAKGFCKNSYIQGLSPSEMFFHAMGGRTGSIDTAIQTAESGYISRKLIKAAEDLMVNYDLSVRNANGNIIQFAYGDDNMDPTKLEHISKIELYELNNEDLNKKYKFEELEDRSYFENFMTPDAIDKMMENNNYIALINKEYNEIVDYRLTLRTNYFENVEAIGDIQTHIPINLYRVISSQLIKFNIQNSDLSDLTPHYIITEFEKIMNDIVYYLPEKDLNWKLFRIIFKSFISTKRILSEYRMNKIAFDDLLLFMKEKMISALITPGEMVGIIGAQTLGEISTQLTLNSVTFETEILVRTSNKKIKKIKIGDFVNENINISNKVDYNKEKDTTYAECVDYYEIPSCDMEGNTVWNRIEAVTQHPVINKDGTNTMLKIKTYNNREVIATKAKSFLQLIDGKIQESSGSDLKVGDYLPVSIKELEYKESFDLHLKDILSPNEYIYGSELEKAKNVMNEHHWWKKHNNITFKLPHKRSDTVYALIHGDIKKTNQSKLIYNEGFVYTMKNSKDNYKIPENISLDYNFGYFLGAYAAEGCMTKNQISISNNNVNYLRPIEEICLRFNVNYKIYKQENKNQENWTSQDIRIYNTVLCNLVEKLIGKFSQNKFVHENIIFSNQQCLRGFLDAYICGDGTIHRRKQNNEYKYESMSITSTSLNLVTDVSIILKNMNIVSNIYKFKKPIKNNRNSQNIQQPYQLYINNEQCIKIAEILNLKDDKKQNKLNELSKRSFKYEISKNYEKIPNIVNDTIIYEDRNDRFKDIIFDKIVSIEEVSNTTNYAYDLTVENTRNFDVYNGLCMRDTFHQAGVGAASLVITQGVPRLKEILRLSKNLKTKNMKIYLKDEYSSDKEKARKIQTKFAYTQIKDVLESSEILYSGKTGNTSLSEDIEFIQSYKEFSELFDIDNIGEEIESPWTLRLKFDKESLMNKKITIQEIQESIKEKSHNQDDIECIYSDDSAQNVIMRIRIRQESTDDFLGYMREFEKQLSEFSLRGITNIQRAELVEGNIIKYNLDGSIKPSKEWAISTEGSNLLEILTTDNVDNKRTYTNDILEFFELFGIEATRELLFRELHKIFQGKPNNRHVQMLSDIMCYRGILMQIERHGLNKNPEVGPIAKASFEEVMNILTNSAVFAEKDNLNGVSANIFAGQFCKSGTNSFEIIVDEEKLLEKVDNSVILESKETINEEEIDNMISEVYEKKEEYENVDDTNFNFGFGIENNQEFMLNDNSDFKLKIDDKDEDLEDVDNIDDIDLEDIVDISDDNTVGTENIDNLELEDIETDKIITEEVVEKPKKEKKTKVTKKTKK